MRKLVQRNFLMKLKGRDDANNALDEEHRVPPVMSPEQRRKLAALNQVLEVHGVCNATERKTPLTVPLGRTYTKTTARTSIRPTKGRLYSTSPRSIHPKSQFEVKRATVDTKTKNSSTPRAMSPTCTL